MKFLLDTSAIIAIVKADRDLMVRVRERSPRDFGISSIAAHELYFGAYKSERIQKNLDRIALLRLQVIDFDRDDAQVAGELRAFLTVAGTPIGPYDVLIAAQAKARDLVLVTRNLREFSRVPGLRLENWESQPK